MNEISIEKIRGLCNDSTIEITYHAYKQMEARHITYLECKQVIMSGDIIESYPDDYPFPSCLILAMNIFSDNLKLSRPLHIVLSVGENKLHLITAYVPTLDRWEYDYKTRKVK